MCYNAKVYSFFGGGAIFGIFPFLCVSKFGVNKEGISKKKRKSDPVTGPVWPRGWVEV